MNSKPILLLVAVLILGVGDANAKRKAPEEVLPVSFQRVKYSAPHWGLANGDKQNGGFIEATALDTGKLLWKLRIYEIKLRPQIGGRCLRCFHYFFEGCEWEPGGFE